MMIGVKGKLMKKLKTIKSIGYLKPERNLQLNALDGSRPPFREMEESHYSNKQRQNHQISDGISQHQQPEIVDVSELMKDLNDQEIGFVDDDDDDCFEMDGKENFSLEGKISDSMKGSDPIKAKDEVEEGCDLLSFRRPDLNSRTLFDPKLLAAFEQAIMEVKAREAERRLRIEAAGLWEVDKDDVLDDYVDPLLEFEERCPPRGRDSIVLYTTGLRAIRKTFEDCQKLRSLLENLRVMFSERDVWMHSGYREELWEVLGRKKVVLPRLFIKGRYIGGVDKVLGLHEKGLLKPLLDGIPRQDNDHGPCQGCLGFRFNVCSNCHGSRKIAMGEEEDRAACSKCNENGMMICPLCC